MLKRAADYCKNIRFDAHRDSAVIFEMREKTVN